MQVQGGAPAAAACACTQCADAVVSLLLSAAWRRMQPVPAPALTPISPVPPPGQRVQPQHLHPAERGVPGADGPRGAFRLQRRAGRRPGGECVCVLCMVQRWFQLCFPGLGTAYNAELDVALAVSVRHQVVQCWFQLCFPKDLGSLRWCTVEPCSSTSKCQAHLKMSGAHAACSCRGGSWVPLARASRLTTVAESW